MQIGPRIRFDKHTLGNLVKNVAPAAAFIPGVGVVGAGLLAAAGGLGRGESLKKAAFSGLGGAATGGGLASIGGKLGIGTGAHLGLGLGGGGAAPVAGASTGGAAPIADVATTGGLDVGAPAVAGAAPPAPGGILGAGKGLLNFAEAHPNAASGALQGLGGIVSGGSENRLRNAQADRLEQEAGETRYDFMRRKQRDEQLAPVWGALGDSLTTGGYAGAARNPYTMAGA